MRRAWWALKSAMGVASADGWSPVTADVLTVGTLRAAADYQMKCQFWADAANTLQLASCIIERRGGAYTAACANVDTAAAHVHAGAFSEAEELLRKAMPVLRKRGGQRANDAAMLMAGLVRPLKRLRGRTHPEDIASN